MKHLLTIEFWESNFISLRREIVNKKCFINSLVFVITYRPMNYDTTVVAGDPEKPAAFFIHGLGMDKRIWESPGKSKVLGGRFPISLLMSREPETEMRGNDEARETSRGLFFGDPITNLTTLFHSLKEQGHTVITWSQQRPSAEIKVAVSELRDVITMYKEYCKSGTILIGHSRGGLVARKYLACSDTKVKALVTLAAPHRGSRMAQWVEYITPLISLINPLLPDSEKGTMTYTMKRIFDFLKSRAVRELLPDSPFFKSLHDLQRNDVFHLSLGGNDPTLFSVYRRVIERVQDGNRERFVVRSRRVFSLPDILEKVIPEKLFPDEMKHGKGDGLVSVESSRIPWADEHYVFDVNHAGILFDDRVRGKVLDAFSRLR
jgi:pimeloyl-ACP methyl ester carboxylesterase